MSTVELTLGINYNKLTLSLVKISVDTISQIIYDANSSTAKFNNLKKFNLKERKMKIKRIISFLLVFIISISAIQFVSAQEVNSDSAVIERKSIRVVDIEEERKMF